MRSMSWSGWIAACVLSLTAGCGGGGGGDAGLSPGTQQGALSLSLSSGSAAGVDHVWVTVSQIALHADRNQPWSASDASWQVVRLQTPALIDLAPLTNGIVGSFVVGQALPAGSYGQVRLFLKPHDSELTQQAKDQRLLFNAQVDFTAADRSVRQVPLELPDTQLGLRVEGPVVIEPDSSNEITLEWSLGHTLVRLHGDGNIDRFTLRPMLRPMRLSATAAIVGLLDASTFCPPGVPSRNCVYDVVASALMPSADGRSKRVVRSAPVVLSGGYAKFGLYPLPASGTVDVVIRGRNMQTIVVRQVPAEPQLLLHAVPVQLGGNPVDPSQPVPMVAVVRPEGDALVSLGAPMVDRAAQLTFSQTLPDAGELPLEIASAQPDPFTGTLTTPVTLPSGPLRVAVYDPKLPLSFTEVEPAEGANHYRVASEGARYTDASPFVAVATPAGTTTSVVAAEPTPKAGMASAPLTVVLTGGGGGRFDAAMLVVADVNGIVTTRDVTSLLGSGGSVSVDLPAGSAAASLGGTAVYSASVRAWKRAAPDTSLVWARAATPADLRSGAAASVPIALP